MLAVKHSMIPKKGTDMNAKGIIGAVIGDVVGSRFEWSNIKKTDFDLFAPWSKFTDDTVMTIAVTEWLTAGGDLALIMQKWGRRYPGAGYGGMFVSGTTSKEIIFALANKRTSNWLRLFTSLNDTDASWNYSMAEDLRMSLFADEIIKSGDIRKDATYNEEFPTRVIKFPNGGQNMGQFLANEDASSSPLVLLRLADVYLIKAEAQGNVNGLSTIKTYMESRYDSVSLPTTMSEREFEDLVLDENQREFYAEGRRWFDIKRTGRTDLYKTWNQRDFLLLWPIPQDERDLAGHDNYPQNPGYSK